jgi:hypothetical protein
VDPGCLSSGILIDWLELDIKGGSGRVDHASPDGEQGIIAWNGACSFHVYTDEDII